MSTAYSRTVKCLAWNTYLLKSLVHTKPFLLERAERMPAFIEGYDVVGLSEEFNADLREDLLAKLRAEYPHVVHGPHTSGTIPQAYLNGRVFNARRQKEFPDFWRRLFSGLRLNGGLMLLSKHEVTNCDVVVFKDTSGVDGFADKGALYAQIKVPLDKCAPLHVFLNVVLTHLQAGEDTEVREAQLMQIADLINAYDDGHPWIIMGDFNVPADTSEYHGMRRILVGCEDLWLKLRPDEHGYTSDSKRNFLVAPPERQRIDYMFLRNSGAYQDAVCKTIALEEFHKKYNLDIDYPHVPNDTAAARRLRKEAWEKRLKEAGGRYQLSDHFALAADIELTPAVLKPKRFWVSPAFAQTYGTFEVKRALYEYGRHVVLFSKEVAAPEDADIHYLLQAFTFDQQAPLYHAVDPSRHTRSIYLNPSVRWSDAPPNSLRYALLHMTGHALGIGHLQRDLGAVMSEWDAQLNLTALTEPDIAALSTLYPARPTTLPEPAATEDALDAQLQTMLEGLKDEYVYSVPRQRPAPVLRVQTSEFHWHNNDDKPDDYDEVLYDVSITIVCDGRELTRMAEKCGGREGFDMLEGKGSAKGVWRTEDVELSLDDLRKGCRLRLACHTYEIDDWPRGGNDDYGHAQRTEWLHDLLKISPEWRQDELETLSEKPIKLSIGTNGWKVTFKVVLVGFRDLANWAVAEGARQQKEQELRTAFRAAALQTTRAGAQHLREQIPLDVKGGLYKTFRHRHGRYLDGLLQMASDLDIDPSGDYRRKTELYFRDTYRMCYPIPGDVERTEFAAYVDQWAIEQYRMYAKVNRADNIGMDQFRSVTRGGFGFASWIEAVAHLTKSKDIAMDLRFYAGMPPEEHDAVCASVLGEATAAYFDELLASAQELVSVRRPPHIPNPWDEYGRFAPRVESPRVRELASALMDSRLPKEYTLFSKAEKLLWSGYERVLQMRSFTRDRELNAPLNTRELNELEGDDGDVSVRVDWDSGAIRPTHESPVPRLTVRVGGMEISELSTFLQ